MIQERLEELKKMGEYSFHSDPSTVPQNWVAWVDEQNRFIAWASRKTTHLLHLPHRSVQIAIINDQQEIILQRRSKDKATYPNYWDLSASGHIEAIDYLEKDPDLNLDQLYHQLAIKELQEEIGICTELRQIGIFKPLTNIHYEHFYFYLGYAQGPFVAQESEVSEIKAFSQGELKALIDQDKCTPSMIYLTQYLIEKKHW